MPAEFARPVDENHALLVGALAGMVMHSRQEGFLYDANIIDDAEGNHLATFFIEAPSGSYLVHVEKVDVADMQARLLAMQARLRDRGKDPEGEK
jgi:hypothetical protein